MAGEDFSIILTYRCNAQCRDCANFSSPYDKSRLDVSLAFKAIDEAKKLFFNGIAFTGGEATLLREELLACISYATKAGLTTSLVSNAQWAISDEAADSFVKDLLLAGLLRIDLSTGDEHLRFVPIENIVRAIAAAANNGLGVFLIFELRQNSSYDYRECLSRIKDACSPDNLAKAQFRFAMSPWMPLNENERGNYLRESYITRENINSFKGCDNILTSYVLEASGHISACCGIGMRKIPELRLSHINDAEPLTKAIKNARSDQFFLALRFLGPEKILAFAGEKNPAISWENMYAHRCHACQRIYHDKIVQQTIREHFSELMSRVNELLP